MSLLSLLLQNCFLITSLLIALSCHNKLQKQVARLIIMSSIIVTHRAQQGHGCSLSVVGRLLQTPPENILLRAAGARPVLSRQLLFLTHHGPRALLKSEFLKISPPRLNSTHPSNPVQVPSPF